MVENLSWVAGEEVCGGLWSGCAGRRIGLKREADVNLGAKAASIPAYGRNHASGWLDGGMEGASH